MHIRLENRSTILPADCIPAEVFYKNDLVTFRFTKMTTAANMNQSKRICHDVPIEEWRKEILEETEVINEERVSNVIHPDDPESIEELNFDIITDGGVSDLNGIFGLVITDGNHPMIKNKGKIYSVDYLESPYRSEMYGVLAGLVTFQSIFHQVLNNQVVNINIYCDNKAVIKRIKDRR